MVFLAVGMAGGSSVLARPEVTFRYGSGTVYVFWESFPNSGFSLSVNDYPYSKPDSLVDTYNDFYVFRNVTPGRHYVHMKYGIGKFWSEPEHWEINLPEVLGASRQRRCFWFFCW